jgi:uncharacterized membrane protein
MQFELLVLRLVHVLGGIFWVGSAVFTTFFLIPALAKAGGPVAGQVMSGMQQRRLYLILPIVAGLTILSGLRLWFILSGGNPTHYFQHRSGHVYAVSGLLAIIAFVLSLAVARPAAVRMGALAQAKASDETSRHLIAAEVAKLQRRATLSGMVAVVLLLIAAAGMAIARYM